jgi:formyltetrahydrofolate deformylase
MTPTSVLLQRGVAAAPRCEAPRRRHATPHASSPLSPRCCARAPARRARCAPLCAAAPRRAHAQHASASADAPPPPPPAGSAAHLAASAAAPLSLSPLPAAPFLADLLVSCPDQKGVVAALAQLLFGYGCNILSSDQHSDSAANRYFQRIHVDYSDLIVGAENVNVLENAMKHTASRFDMTWSIHYHTKCVRALAKP